VIPAYRRADVLGRAVDSALAQTVTDLEVLVVDDGSGDDTEAVVEGYDDRVRYLAHDRNRGVSAARNTGVEAATGEYVAFLDSDDEWLPRKLEAQLDRVAGGDWVGAYCDVVPADLSLVGRLGAHLSKRVVRSRAPREGGRELAAALLSMQVFMSPGSTLLVERAAVEAAGGFDEGLSIYEDWDLVLRVLAAGRLAYVDEPLVVTHFTGDAPAAAYVENDRRYLERNADLVADLEADGLDVTRVHRLGLAGHFLGEGDFRGAAEYLDAGVLARPVDLARVAFWTVLAVRARLFGGEGA
jgi:glycosyltransferase involved in cell wall biosynthesis